MRRVRRNVPVLEPLLTTPTKEFMLAREVTNHMKMMPSETIESVYRDLDVEGLDLDVQPHGTVGGRSVVKVTKDGDEMYFYKSTGTSRKGMDTEGYWFPCQGDCESQGRLRKLEDRYVEDIHFMEQELKEHPEIATYQRFITKDNAMISKWLKTHY